MGIWSGMRKTLRRGYEYFEKNEMKECLQAWEPAWEQMKRNIANAEIKPELYEVDEATDYEFDFESWLSNMATAYLAAKRYDDGIKFCMEVIETFPWKQTAPNNFNQSIGEALELKGEPEKSDAWFEDWLKREPENFRCIFECAIHLAGRNQVERAEKLVDDALKDKECNYETHDFFMRGVSFFSVTGNKEKEKHYRAIEQDYFHKFLDNPVKYGSRELYDEEDFFFESDLAWEQPLNTIVKDKKIYPNDPCPCGSGKKYKKCCGKNK